MESESTTSDSEFFSDSNEDSFLTQNEINNQKSQVINNNYLRLKNMETNFNLLVTLASKRVNMKNLENEFCENLKIYKKSCGDFSEIEFLDDDYNMIKLTDILLIKLVISEIDVHVTKLKDIFYKYYLLIKQVREC